MSCTHFSNSPLSDWAEPVSRDFAHWEIFSEADHFVPGREREINELLGATGMTCSVHAPICDLNVAALSDRLMRASIDETIAVIRASVEIGARTVTVHPGLSSMSIHGTEERATVRAKRAMRELEAAGQEYGAVLAIENMPNAPFFLGRTAEALADIIDGTDLGVCFDIGHANTTSQIREMTELLGDRIVNVHIHDNDGDRDAHMTIGDGSIDFGPVLQSLSGYGGSYIIEAKCLESAVESQSRLRKMLS